MALRTVSVDSGTEAQVAARRNEMQRKWASTADPLDILIRLEERACVILAKTNSLVINDREFISRYINRVLGESYVRSRHCTAGPASRRGRNGNVQDTPDGWIRGGRSAADRCNPRWHRGARVVG